MCLDLSLDGINTAYEHKITIYISNPFIVT